MIVSQWASEADRAASESNGGECGGSRKTIKGLPDVGSPLNLRGDGGN